MQLGVQRALWVIGDPHGGHDPERDRALVAAIHAATTRRVDLLFMGDLFVVWLGPSRFWTGPQRAILAAVRRHRQAGLRAVFVVGNRDHLVHARSCGALFDPILTGENLLRIRGRWTLVRHGDGLDPHDQAYRLFARLARSAAVESSLQALPGQAGRALARCTERGLRPLNQRFKHLRGGDAPWPGRGPDPLHRHSVHAARRGAHEALLGHFHRGATVTAPGGVPVTVAPAFFERDVVLQATDRGWVRIDPLQ